SPTSSLSLVVVAASSSRTTSPSCFFTTSSTTTAAAPPPPPPPQQQQYHHHCCCRYHHHDDDDDDDNHDHDHDDVVAAVFLHHSPIRVALGCVVVCAQRFTPAIARTAARGRSVILHTHFTLVLSRLVCTRGAPARRRSSAPTSERARPTLSSRSAPRPMSTAVAAPPASTPLGPSLDRIVSPRPFSALQSSPSSGAEPAAKRVRSNASPPSSSSSSSVVVEHPHHRPSLSNGRTSPTAYPPAVACHARDRREDTTADAASASLRAPAIQVKKEPPTSPPLRPRPKRLDLSSSSRPNPSGGGPHTSRPSAGPLTSRDSAGLAVQDVGLACLSPGFQTNDPGMREQLQRSLDVRDQQRQIISARQKGGSGSKPGSAATPAAPRRKGPPPGLTISAPSAAAFAAQDRVIQSAPMNQTFTGLRPGEHPFAPRPVQHHGPSGLSQNSHIYHVPATQTSNRLPPLADVFGSHHHSPPAPPPPPAGPTEYRSAEEAVQGLSGGREDLLPKWPDGRIDGGASAYTSIASTTSAGGGAVGDGDDNDDDDISPVAR
ncbi:hypothetical protein M433DRAFT_138810, partial [Acidomyces richmondensis BFW]